jgi:hypothetical protein
MLRIIRFYSSPSPLLLKKKGDAQGLGFVVDF